MTLRIKKCTQHKADQTKPSGLHEYPEYTNPVDANFSYISKIVFLGSNFLYGLEEYPDKPNPV